MIETDKIVYEKKKKAEDDEDEYEGHISKVNIRFSLETYFVIIFYLYEASRELSLDNIYLSARNKRFLLRSEKYFRK